MTDVSFDTMATARFLRESGIEERQAAAITTAIKDGVTGGVATRADIVEVKMDIVEVRADIARLESELRTERRWMKLIGRGRPGGSRDAVAGRTDRGDNARVDLRSRVGYPNSGPAQ